MFLRGLKVILAVFSLGLLLSCAASKPEVVEGTLEEKEKKEIETLLGISETQPESMTEEDEGEVLRLLGIMGEESTEMDTEEASLKEAIARLEEEIGEKDAEIARLKAELSAKEEQIVRLESKLARAEEKKTVEAKYRIPSDEYRIRYQDALAEYKKRNYKTAIRLFEELLAANPTHDLADNCQYWIGESYYGLGKYNQAIVEFQKVFAFTKTNKDDDAQLKLGLCYLKLGDTRKAREELERLLSNYPRSEYRSVAQKLLSGLK